MLGNRFDPSSPEKFTRLHLLGLKDARVLQADSSTTSQSPVQYRWTQLMVQRRAAEGNLESAWTALIEPYAGKPFVQSVKLLDIDGNETDARKAVAVEVLTTNGHTDVCFADGRPEKVRKVSGVRFQVSGDTENRHPTPETRNLDLHVSGEFAYCSTDSQGLRQATLAGGTLLEAAGITIKVARREYTGKVIAADYHKKTLTIDTAWPSSAAGRLFEIGRPGHWTSYASTRLTPGRKSTVVTVDAGADFFRSQILKIETDPEKIQEACEQANVLAGRPAGRDQDVAARAGRRREGLCSQRRVAVVGIRCGGYGTPKHVRQRAQGRC